MQRPDKRHPGLSITETAGCVQRPVNQQLPETLPSTMTSLLTSIFGSGRRTSVDSQTSEGAATPSSLPRSSLGHVPSFNDFSLGASDDSAPPEAAFPCRMPAGLHGSSHENGLMIDFVGTGGYYVATPDVCDCSCCLDRWHRLLEPLVRRFCRHVHWLTASQVLSLSACLSLSWLINDVIPTPAPTADRPRGYTATDGTYALYCS